MHNLQLYINQELVDLADDSPIALTFQINNLAEVRNQQGNTSNQFKLPLTQRNRIILGFADKVAICTDAPYKQYQARIIQDGIETVPYGTAELNSIEQDAANMTILSGNVDFFDAIDAKIYDMGDSTTTTGAQLPFKSYNHDWTLDNVVNSQRKTKGWIWPVVDYGKVDTDTTQPVDVRYLRPGFFLKTAIDIIVGNAGYKAQGSLLSDPLYQKLIVQFANDSFAHGSNIQNQRNVYSIAVHSTAPQTCAYQTSNSGHENTIAFQAVDDDPSHSFNTSSFAFEAPIDMVATVEFAYSIGVQLSGKKTKGMNVFIQFYDPATDMLNHVVYNAHDTDQPKFVPKNYLHQKLSADVTFKKGQTVICGYTLLDGNVLGIISPGATFTVTNKQGDVLFGHTIQCERIFPDIGQKDLLKDTLQRFGIICQTDNTNRTVTFASFRDIVNNIPNAYDWTEKCIDQGKTISFQLGGYAQANNMKYKADDSVLPTGFADSVIKVADTTLPATTDLFESQFAPTQNRPWINGTIAVINKVDQSSNENTDFNISTQPRILVLETINAQNISFTDGPNTRTLNNDVVAVPYFHREDRPDSLKFENLRQRYYSELERILKQSKKVVRLFLLTPLDIAQLDLLIPVYLRQDGAYFYINKIDAWQKGKPTKVELIKLG
ncbi:hypothetical protein [Mucilaginibacter ginkgonis]|uniref:Uncharacterized protein n=1 Tax=Mucilaginibacter ginkgonis TaxID=2682091 RepID=A0A6I4HU24_9SPHI|nr:hypothetical protein [Mucilaginibacter ginkgonis]QQL50341.1 hypothetical protein GO620_002480 [Mucilaginibacter ginkgonis]